jgi:hypothetical protein
LALDWANAGKTDDAKAAEAAASTERRLIFVVMGHPWQEDALIERDDGRCIRPVS